MTETPYIVVQVSAASAEQAWTIARALVERRLAASAQVFPIRSCYVWEGQIVESDEHLIQLKTRAEHFEALAACVKGLHSYQIPSIVALPISAGAATYLKWIDEVVAVKREEDRSRC